MSSRTAWRRCANAVVLAIVASCGEPGGPDPDNGASSTTTPAVPEGTITLITGDRVTLATTQGEVAPHIQPGPGRERLAFTIRSVGGELTVLPEDAAALVGSGQLDPALFNITQLIADGYGDDRRSDIPLIITGQPDLSTSRRLIATAGVTVDHTMPVLGAMAVRQDKASAGASLASLTATTSVASRGATARPKIWLDRNLERVLDRSAPQVGAPAAHARGLTGAGVTVAVLDTGIDATHPDLAGRVAAAESFVNDGLGTSDVVGHGTHVASIVAGSGAASDGTFAGVAPGATLLSGRVCGRASCPESAILAGMEWAAVTRKARIINMSLGGTDLPDIDPLEDAVNRLSTQFGALFVVSAGNRGFSGFSVTSPATADAAPARQHRRSRGSASRPRSTTARRGRRSRSWRSVIARSGWSSTRGARPTFRCAARPPTSMATRSSKRSSAPTGWRRADRAAWRLRAVWP